MLIRKGGIREARPIFEPPSDRVLLFPTYEHQTATAVQPPYPDRVINQAVPQVGDPVSLPGWAQITHALFLGTTPPDDVIAALRPFHIWTDDWLRDRLAWKPERPACVLLLRGHRFTRPIPLTYQSEHRGCRSWITVDVAAPLPDSTPALSDDIYVHRVAQIQQAIAPLTMGV